MNVDAPRKQAIMRGDSDACFASLKRVHYRPPTVMSLTFQPNERVLCYHGPLIYEAKVLKAEVWNEQNTRTGEVGPHFFVHYKGWKQTCVLLR